MRQRPSLTLEDVKKMAAAAVAEATRLGLRITFAICDDRGHPLWLQRLDGAAPVSATIAPEKARSAAIGRRETKACEDMVNGGRVSALSMPLLTHLEGGVPVMVAGDVIGAVGVSGAKSAEDAQIARAGIAALGL